MVQAEFLVYVFVVVHVVSCCVRQVCTVVGVAAVLTIATGNGIG